MLLLLPPYQQHVVKLVIELPGYFETIIHLCR
jgi:hypothetical protein